MIPILYDETEIEFTSNGIGGLCDTAFCNVTEERNGIYEIELRYPLSGALFEYINEGCYIKAKPNETSDPQIFRIYQSSKPISGQVTFRGEHISYELKGCPIDSIVISNATATEALNKILDASLVPHKYRGISDIPLRASTSFSFISARAALGGVEGSLLDTYGGEFEFDNYTVKLHADRGRETGIIIAYGKNLTDFKQEKNISETYTAIFPYAKYTPDAKGGETSKEITVTLHEKVIHTIETNHPNVFIKDFTDEFSESEAITEAALRSKTESYIKTSGFDKPSVSINVSFVHLWQSPEYSERYAALERVSLCDTVTVNFEKLGVSVKAKVIKTVYDTLKEKYISIELGDAKSNFADTIKQTSTEISSIKTETKKNESATVKRIAAAIANATALITGQNGGYVVLNPSNNPQEILIMDKPSINEAVNVWRWNSGGLGFSSTGYNGTYKTAITNDGQIVADFISAGVFDGALIRAGSIQAEAISVEYKNTVTDEISEAETRLTSSFQIADGELRSAFSEQYSSLSGELSEKTETLQTQISQTNTDITTTATAILGELAADREELETKISQNAEAITLAAEKITETASDITTLRGELTTTATAIRGEVASQIEDIEGNISTMQSGLDITAGNISSIVRRTYGATVTGSGFPTDNTDKDCLYYDTDAKLYYHYNIISEAWEEIEGNSIQSAFIQTADGFSLSGIVSISGDLITEGTISSERIDTNNLSCTALYAKDHSGGYSVRLNGSLGDFGIFNPNASDVDYANSSDCMFGVYNSIGSINFCSYGKTFLTYITDGGQRIAKPQGTWDFSECGGNLTAKAVFG